MQAHEEDFLLDRVFSSGLEMGSDYVVLSGVGEVIAPLGTHGEKG